MLWSLRRWCYENKNEDVKNQVKSDSSDKNTNKTENQHRPKNKKAKKRFQSKRVSRDQHAWKRRNENKVVDLRNEETNNKPAKIPVFFDEKDSIGHVMSENDDSLDEFKKIEAESMQIDGSTPVFYDLQDIDNDESNNQNTPENK